MKVKVFDSPVFINASELPGKGLTTPEVLGELKDLKSKMLAEAGVKKGIVRVVSPSKQAFEYVMKKLKNVGLSEADFSVLALAYERKAVLVTDDFNLQNAAMLLGLEVEPVVRGRIKFIRDV